MGKQRKQRQQPSKKKVQVKQKITKQDSSTTAPAKKLADAKVPEDAKHIRVYGLSNLGNTCFYNSALQVRSSASMPRDATAVKMHTHAIILYSSVLCLGSGGACYSLHCRSQLTCP